MNDCCEKCRFWERGYEPQKGNCRRRSPVPCEGMNQWPVTESHDWCGEFEAVAVEEKPANPCVECGKGTEPYLGYVPFYSGAELKFIHQTCANERLKRGEKIYQ